MHWLISHWRVFPWKYIRLFTPSTFFLGEVWFFILHQDKVCNPFAPITPLAHRSPIFSALFLLLSPWIPCFFLLSNDVCPHQNCPSLLEVALLAIWRMHVLPNLINFGKKKTPHGPWPSQVPQPTCYRSKWGGEPEYPGPRTPPVLVLENYVALFAGNLWPKGGRDIFFSQAGEAGERFESFPAQPEHVYILGDVLPSWQNAS